MGKHTNEWLSEYIVQIGKGFYLAARALIVRTAQGPHRIIEVINPVVYKAMVDGKVVIVHANKIKRDPSKRQIRPNMDPFEVFTDEIVGEMLKTYNEELKAAADNLPQLHLPDEVSEVDRLETAAYNNTNLDFNANFNPDEVVELRQEKQAFFASLGFSKSYGVSKSIGTRRLVRISNNYLKRNELKKSSK